MVLCHQPQAARGGSIDTYALVWLWVEDNKGCHILCFVLTLGGQTFLSSFDSILAGRVD